MARRLADVTNHFDPNGCTSHKTSGVELGKVVPPTVSPRIYSGVQGHNEKPLLVALDPATSAG